MDKSIVDMHKRCNICNIYTILFQAVVVCLHFSSNNFGADHSILLGTDFWTLLELRNRNTFGSSFDWNISATGGGRGHESLLSLGQVPGTTDYSDVFLHCPQQLFNAKINYDIVKYIVSHRPDIDLTRKLTILRLNIISIIFWT